jgi:hypothetical protein
MAAASSLDGAADAVGSSENEKVMFHVTVNISNSMECHFLGS